MKSCNKVISYCIVIFLTLNAAIPTTNAMKSLKGHYGKKTQDTTLRNAGVGSVITGALVLVAIGTQKAYSAYHEAKAQQEQMTNFVGNKPEVQPGVAPFKSKVGLKSRKKTIKTPVGKIKLPYEYQMVRSTSPRRGVNVYGIEENKTNSPGPVGDKHEAFLKELLTPYIPNKFDLMLGRKNDMNAIPESDIEKTIELMKKNNIISTLLIVCSIPNEHYALVCAHPDSRQHACLVSYDTNQKPPFSIQHINDITKKIKLPLPNNKHFLMTYQGCTAKNIEAILKKEKALKSGLRVAMLHKTTPGYAIAEYLEPQLEKIRPKKTSTKLGLLVLPLHKELPK